MVPMDSCISGHGHYTDTGRATDPVCLPQDPSIGGPINSDYAATVYGMEYADNFGSLYYKDVPCVVCRANHVTSKVMIPGKFTCHVGWRKEYSGMLVAGYHRQEGASSYFCMETTLVVYMIKMCLVPYVRRIMLPPK
ncbi:uncharacterized protein LOC134726556 [Mytilus trossulus]|uniref:uncharacterized protein LOC134726556 n=1 Tax=Mytilus trossulus TaxID=6551 RepID=UPI0030076ECD